MNHPLLEIKNISKSFGKQVVLDNLSFVVNEGQKIAFIGRNGAGKSTLINILTGKEEADAGDVQFMPITRVGVVNQHETLPSKGSSLDYLESVSNKQPWEIKKLAARFELKQELEQIPTDLSGGYQMRVKLIAMLLKDPNLLLLDEPVNYLDLSTLLLLERFLKTYNGSFLLIAHDREFLQNTCEETYEIERGELVHYRGGVSEYLDWKQEQIEFAKRSNKKLKREMAHHQTFVDRFRYKASLATRAQSKLKHIEKLRRKITSINADLATTRIAIPCPHTTSGMALAVEDATIGYPERTIATDISFDIMRGEKVLIAGNNGMGKSTFLKTIIGDLPIKDGKYKWFHRAKIGYFDQLTERTLKPKETVLHYLSRMAPENTSGEGILMMAGNFLFKGDDLDKPTSVLSGGERARLCLAGVLLHENNVLVLDEPTNHLDVETTEALALALKHYKGTVIFVSHARTFVNALADRIIEVKDQRLRYFTGNYEDYIEDLENNFTEEELEVEDENEDKKRARKERAHERRTTQRELSKLDKKIAALETEKSEILKFFFENPTDYAPDKANRLQDITKELASHEAKWLTLHEQLEHLS